VSKLAAGGGDVAAAAGADVHIDPGLLERLLKLMHVV